MAVATFEQGLQAQLDSGAIDPKSAFGRRVKRVLNCPFPARKDRVLERMESHARVHLGYSADKKVNWAGASIDWKSLLELFMQLLPLLLALFGI